MIRAAPEPPYIVAMRGHYIPEYSSGYTPLIAEMNARSLYTLNLNGMTARCGSRKRGLNRTMLEQSPATVMQQLSYKPESAGGKKMSPQYTAQRYSSCGGMPARKITPSVRSYRSQRCGPVLDRDVNAARLIHLKGLDLFSRAGDLMHRADAALQRHTVPLASERSFGAKDGCDAESSFNGCSGV